MSTPEQRAQAFRRWSYALRHEGPLTEAEQAEYNAQRAREMHRAEQRRQPTEPQLELPEAA